MQTVSVRCVAYNSGVGRGHRGHWPKLELSFRTDIRINLPCKNADGTPFNLAGKAIKISWRDKVTGDIVLARAATVVSAGAGTCYALIVQSDSPILLNGLLYDTDVIATTASTGYEERLTPVFDTEIVDSVGDDGDVTVPATQTPLGYPINFWRGAAELTDPGLQDIVAATLPALTAGPFEVKIGVIDPATGRSGSWIAIGHYEVDDAGVLTFPRAVQIDESYLHSSLEADGVEIDIVEDGAGGFSAQGDPGTHGLLKWAAQITLVDAGQP